MTIEKRSPRRTAGRLVSFERPYEGSPTGKVTVTQSQIASGQRQQQTDSPTGQSSW